MSATGKATARRQEGHLASLLRPFTHLAARVPLDELNPATSSLKGEARRLAQASARQNWTEVDRADPTIVAHAIWQSRRPGEPFPTKFFHPPPKGEDDDN